MSSSEKPQANGVSKRTRNLLAPGDGLRQWWDGLSRVQKWGFGVLLFGGLALLPLYTPPFLDTPGISFGGTMAQFAMVAIIAIGLNVVVGQAGLLDLGYVGFYAVGAYTVALLTSPDSPWNKVGPNGFLSTPWAWLSCVPIAMCITAMAGLILGIPTLRLRGDYLAIVTLGFGEILPQIARNGDNLFGTGFNLTNGTGGITPIDGPGFGNWLHDHLHLPANFLTASNLDAVFLWAGIVLVLITVFCSARLRDSRLGRAWIAIREDETAAAAMGVPLMRTKTWSYATGAFFGGVAGAFYASYKSGAFPDDFFFQISVFILCMVILGGMGNIWGVIFGACFLTYLDREGLANIGTQINNQLNTNFQVPKYEFGIFGVIIVVVMLFRPEGLIPSSRRAAELHEGVHDEPLYDQEIAGA
jgi:branched-chain amino acid transport system permease protein